MKSNKLVKTPITDKNGKNTTVYRSPESQTEKSKRSDVPPTLASPSDNKDLAHQISSMLKNNMGYVNFGDVARYVLNMQAQYASYYIMGIGGYPNISEGIRFEGNQHNFHSLSMHPDDAVIFVSRVKDKQKVSV